MAIDGRSENATLYSPVVLMRGSVFRRMKLGSKSSHSVCCKT